MTRLIHPELAAVFAEHATPTHASKRDVHDALTPIVRLAARVQQQVATFRELIAQAELAPHDHALDGKLEAMHQTYGALERDAAILARAARDVAREMTQLERVAAEWQTTIAAYEDSRRATESQTIAAADVGDVREVLR